MQHFLSKIFLKYMENKLNKICLKLYNHNENFYPLYGMEIIVEDLIENNINDTQMNQLILKVFDNYTKNPMDPVEDYDKMEEYFYKNCYIEPENSRELDKIFCEIVKLFI